MRFQAYVGASVGSSLAVILHAFNQRPNFYSASVYLAQSQACRMILLNLVVLCAYSIIRALQKLLYGPLRPIEREQLWDKSWYAITETALAMTTFRDEVGIYFLAMFACLLAGKVWGWISEWRVETLEQQPPANPRLFHIRLVTSLLVSEIFGALFLQYCVQNLIRQPRPGMMVMFAFEFAVLLITSTSTFARYSLSVQESLIVKRQTKARLEERREEIRAAREEARRQTSTEVSEDDQAATEETSQNEEVDENDIDVPGWQEKGRWVLLLDLVTDFMKLSVYMMFFVVLLLFHGLPIHIFRDVYLTLRSFLKRITDFQKYRNATKDMNSRYSDATEEELRRDGTCIICREDMRPWQNTENQDPAPEGIRRPNRSPPDERQRAKKLPCGHILHLGCLKSWLERQQVCPTCRTSVLAPSTPTSTNQQGEGNNDRPAAPPGAGQAGHQQNQNIQRGQNPGQARARTFNLGSWRVTFAAGNNLQIRDTLQRLQQNNQGPAAPNPQVNGDTRSQNFLQSRSTNNQDPASLQEQLLNVEQQLHREIESLNLARTQLEYVRGLQAELTRLRLTQTVLQTPHGQQNLMQGRDAGNINGQAQIPPMIRLPGTNSSQSHQQPLPPFSGPQMPQQAFSSAYHNTGSTSQPNLPSGMTLPDGWNLIPLRRVGPNPNQNQVQPVRPPEALNVDHLVRQATVNSQQSRDSVNDRQTNHITSSDSNINSDSTPRQGGSIDENSTTQRLAPSFNWPDSIPATSEEPLPANEAASESTHDAVEGQNGYQDKTTKTNEVEQSMASGGGQTRKGKERAATVEDVVDDTDQ